MLYTVAPEFQWKISNVDNTRPASPWGASITPAQNAYGSYTEVLSAANMAYDAYGIMVLANVGVVAGQARDMLLNIAIDPAGGTSWTELKIPDLLVSNAGGIDTLMGGISYYFPIFLPAGCSVAAAASVNNATVGTVNVICRVFGRPKYPALVKAGQAVTAYGIVAASSRGTSLTMGTTSEGTRVSLGATSSHHWYWQLGIGLNNNNLNVRNGAFDLDHSDDGGTTFTSIIEDQYVVTSAGEALSFRADLAGPRAWKEVASGSTLYARAQGIGAVDTGWSAAAYGVKF